MHKNTLMNLFYEGKIQLEFVDDNQTETSKIKINKIKIFILYKN